MKQRLSRWLPALLAALMIFGLAACGGTAEVNPAEPEESAVTQTEDVPESSDADVQEPDDSQSDADGDRSVPEDTEAQEDTLDEDGAYTTKEDVALYLHLYGHLPDNFITKKQAQKLGWSGGSLEPYAPGCSIGGSRFGNYEGLLPDKEGRTWTECDIDTMGAKSRGPKRIVFSNDGLIYYTGDHYESFELLYGEE